MKRLYKYICLVLLFWIVTFPSKSSEAINNPLYFNGKLDNRFFRVKKTIDFELSRSSWAFLFVCVSLILIDLGALVTTVEEIECYTYWKEDDLIKGYFVYYLILLLAVSIVLGIFNQFETVGLLAWLFVFVSQAFAVFGAVVMINRLSIILRLIPDPTPNS